MTRQKFTTRTIYFVSDQQIQTALALLPNLPIDAKNPLEMVIREKAKIRKPSQSALMFAGALKDMSEQAYFNGRSFSVDFWHFFMKKEFLPEEAEEGITKDDYKKWEIDPKGERILVGSTTQLTVKGFSIYLEKLQAYAVTEYGVEFHANPKQYGE